MHPEITRMVAQARIDDLLSDAAVRRRARAARAGRPPEEPRVSRHRTRTRRVAPVAGLWRWAVAEFHR